MTVTTRQVLLHTRPTDATDYRTWKYVSVKLPPLEDGQVLIKVDYVSLDPAMRGWLNAKRSYIEPVAIGAVMRAHGVGTVIESRNLGFSEGDAVMGLLGATEHSISDGVDLTHVDLSEFPAPTWLGSLGMPGITAYFGLLDVGRLAPGDTVLVSGAAGAVGNMVGQIAKAKGARVIGIAGGPEKARWLTESLGFDAVIDYKNESIRHRLRDLAPEGVDVFFDNVGGTTLDDGLANLRRGARVVICGAIASYNDSTAAPGPSRYMALLIFRASMTGFVATDYEDRYAEAVDAISQWMVDGVLVAREHVVEGGIDTFGDALSLLFSGGNTGKLVLKL